MLELSAERKTLLCLPVVNTVCTFACLLQFYLWEISSRYATHNHLAIMNIRPSHPNWNIDEGVPTDLTITENQSLLLLKDDCYTHRYILWRDTASLACNLDTWHGRIAALNLALSIPTFNGQFCGEDVLTTVGGSWLKRLGYHFSCFIQIESLLFGELRWFLFKSDGRILFLGFVGLGMTPCDRRTSFHFFTFVSSLLK